MAINFSLPRSIPWTTSQIEPGVQARDLVDERFDTVGAYIIEARDDLAAAIMAMRNSLAPIVVNDISISGIDVPDLGGDIPSFTQTFDEVFTAVAPTFTVDYVEPDGQPGEAPVWTDEEIALKTEFISKVADWLTNGGTAIPPAIEAQIFDAAMLRLEEEHAAKIAKLTAEAADRNFELPETIIAAEKARVLREFSKGVSELSGSIAQKNMEMTQANMHKAIDAAQAYVASALDYLVKKNMAKVDIYKATVEAWVSRVEAAIKVIEAKVEAFKGEVEAFKASADAYKVKADVFEAAVGAYTALVGGLKAKNEVIAESIKMKVQVFTAESTAAIEEEKLRVQAQSQSMQLAERLAEAEAGLHSQTLAGLLSSVHVQAGISASHSTGQQVGFSYSYGEQMSEQHSESESVQITAER
ncbi:hypothetical protein LLG39_08915 [bacterium]|nr:hypothetical protein [bacterium]